YTPEARRGLFAFPRGRRHARCYPDWSSDVCSPNLQLLARLPGPGPRSARRAALHLIKKREQLMTLHAGAIHTPIDKIAVCRVCGDRKSVVREGGGGGWSAGRGKKKRRPHARGAERE